MALQTASFVGGFFNYAGNSTASMTSAGHKVAFIQQVPVSGSITAVMLRVQSVSSAQTLRVSLQTIGSDGRPSGSAYGGSVYGTQASPSTLSYVVTLGTPATAVAGDIIAVVIEWDSTAGNVGIGYVGSALGVTSLPVVVTYNGSAWSTPIGNSAPLCGLSYSGVYYPNLCFTRHGNTSTAFNSSSSPDEYGIRLYLPYSIQVNGVLVALQGAAGADFDVCLYRGTTLMTSVSVDGDLIYASGLAANQLLFPAAQILLPNVEYVLSVKPTTTTSLTLSRATSFLSNALLGAYPLGTNGYEMTRSDAGSWSSSTTTVPCIVPLISAVFDGGVVGRGLGRGIF